MPNPGEQGAAATVSSRIEVLGNIGPNWFASVMGTGIVATAGATLAGARARVCAGSPKWSG